MHAYVNFVRNEQPRPELAEEALKLHKELLPKRQQQHPGYQGTLLLVNRQTGKSMTISMYETEDEVKAVEHSGEYRRHVAKFAHLFSTSPSRDIYEVAYYGLSK